MKYLCCTHPSPQSWQPTLCPLSQVVPHMAAHHMVTPTRMWPPPGFQTWWRRWNTLVVLETWVWASRWRLVCPVPFWDLRHCCRVVGIHFHDLLYNRTTYNLRWATTLTLHCSATVSGLSQNSDSTQIIFYLIYDALIQGTPNWWW